MARVWYVGTYPYREITPQDWDRAGVFGPHLQFSADNGWSVDQDDLRPSHIAVLAADPEFLLDQEGPRPDTPEPPDDVTRPYKADASILALVDDAFEALDLAESALEDIQDSVTAANDAAAQAGTYRNQAQGFRNEAEGFRNTASTAASTATGAAATATTKAGEALGAASAASASASAAGDSRDAAALSESNAKTSEDNAKDSEDAAALSASEASSSELAAIEARDDAEVFRDQARASALKWLGEWASGTAYVKYDVVNYQGASWLAMSGSTGVTPGEDRPEWALLAAKGERGEDGVVSQAMLDDAVATLVDGAPAALNTLSELATSLGNDPNFATTVSTQIGERAKTSDVNAALNLKADKTDPRFTDSRNPTAHEHGVADIDASGTASSSTFLRGDGVWGVPTDTTYAAATQAEAENPSSTVARLITGQRLRQAANAAITARVVPVTSFPASPDPLTVYLKVE